MIRRSSHSALRVAVVDHEPSSREWFRAFLGARSDVEVVAECGGAVDALSTLLEREVSLIILDVRTRDVDGFELLEQLACLLGRDRLPAVIFVTAGDIEVVRLFERGGHEYLLEPLAADRVEQALARTRGALQGAGGAAGVDRRLRTLLRTVRAERGAKRSHRTRFAVRVPAAVSFVDATDIDWVEADGNYVRLHAQGKRHLVRETLKSVEARLDPRQFVRVHRSAIVNVQRIAAREPYTHGEFLLTLRDGSKLTSSRTYSTRVRELVV